MHRISTLFIVAGLMAAPLVSIGAALPAVADVTTYYKYDDLGRVILSSQSTGGQGGYSYDTVDNRTAMRQAVISGPSAVDRLSGGQGLVVNASIHSASGRYTLVMQTDGNLVVYGQSGALWSAITATLPAAHAVMQTDGNLVIYGPVGQVLWTSGTGGHAGSTLVMQDDGNLVIYQGSTGIWSSNTACGLC